MTMRAYTEGCRAMAAGGRRGLRRGAPHPDAEVRKQNQAFYEFMVPLVKGYSTEMSLEVTSLGVQVHGGMGFIEETGAAQYYRDAQHPDHLRRHHRDPGQRPGGPQDRARRRRGGAGHRRRRSRPPKRELQRSGSDAAQGHGQAPDGRAPGLRGRGRLRRRQDQGQPERGLRRQRALPDAGRQRGGRLADGACAAGRRGPAGRGHRRRSSCGPRSPPRASTPTTS